MFSQDHLDICRVLPDGALIVSGTGEVLCANEAAAGILGIPRAQIETRSLSQIADGVSANEALRKFSRSRSPLPARISFHLSTGIVSVRCNGCLLIPGAAAADTAIFILLTERNRLTSGFTALNLKIEELNREIAARRRAELLLAGQQEVLEMILHERPLPEVLAQLCLKVEQHSPTVASASILLLDGDRLRHGAAPSLPPEYTEAIDGVRIGESVGSCGTAAFLASPVIVEDIEHDPRWAAYKELALRWSLRACWSVPILSADGKVLGTFAVYYPDPRHPGTEDWNTLHLAVRTAVVAIESAKLHSERFTREAALRRKDEQLSAALTASKTGTYRWDNNANILEYFDEQLAILFGYESPFQATTPEQFLQRIHPDDLSLVLEALRRSRDDDADIDMEYRVVLPDGKIRWLYDRGRALQDESCVVGACTDITDRKRAEQSFVESQQQFRVMADTIPQLAWMADGAGSINWYNERWYEYTGTTAQEMQGWGWQSVHEPRELPRVIEKWTRAIREGTAWEDSFPLKGKDGQFRIFLSRAIPIRDSEGTVVRWFGTNTDISEHLNTQDQLRRTEKLAAAGRLAASIAHEINNPLEAIANLLFLSLMDEGVPDRVKALLTTADQELRRVTHIAGQTLGFYKDPTQPVRFSIADVFEDVLRVYQGKLREKHVAIERSYRSRGEIVASLGEMRQVIANLISNALDAASGSGRLILRVSQQEWRGLPALRVTIADDGSGIPMKIMPMIFEPFFTSKKDVGTGLGLWVSKEIVKKAGGLIAVRSRTGSSGHGTVFSILLPTRIKAESKESSAAVRDGADTVQPTLT